MCQATLPFYPLYLIINLGRTRAPSSVTSVLLIVISVLRTHRKSSINVSWIDIHSTGRKRKSQTDT